MTESDAHRDLLFSQPWFSHAALTGFNDLLTQRYGFAAEKEKNIVKRTLLELLERQRDGRGAQYSDLLDFFVFCYPRLSESSSQILQDLWVLYMLNEKSEGYFVEFGACDGLVLSNTKLLEAHYSWSGILAEPAPCWHDDLRRNRTCTISTDCVAGSSGEQVSFMSVENMPELSRVEDCVPDDVHEKNGNRSVNTKVLVPTITLADLLRRQHAPDIIDYLSVDTEGSEYEILKVFDFDEFTFRLITVEHAGEQKKRENIRTLLEGQGYVRWDTDLSRWDDWYFHPESLRV